MCNLVLKCWRISQSAVCCIDINLIDIYILKLHTYCHGRQSISFLLLWSCQIFSFIYTHQSHHTCSAFGYSWPDLFLKRPQFGYGSSIWAFPFRLCHLHTPYQFHSKSSFIHSLHVTKSTKHTRNLLYPSHYPLSHHLIPLFCFSVIHLLSPPPCGVWLRTATLHFPRGCCEQRLRKHFRVFSR